MGSDLSHNPHPLLVFDYDKTLISKSGEFYSQIPEMLKILLMRGHSIAIASFNTYVEKELAAKGMTHMFCSILGNQTQTKAQMIHAILKKHNRSSLSTIFFDDLATNVCAISRMGVQSFHVPRGGVTLKHVEWSIEKLIKFDSYFHEINKDIEARSTSYYSSVMDNKTNRDMDQKRM